MPSRLADVIRHIEEIADPRWAFTWDRVGLQIGDPDRTISKAIVSLDWSLELVHAADSGSCGLVVCHHPLIWEPFKSIGNRTRAERCALNLIERKIAFYACHTQWDCAPGGVNDALASLLKLNKVQAFGEVPKSPMLKLAVFCPVETADAIIDAASSAGAGSIGAYSRCAFLSRGTGTFVGGSGTNPAIGEAGRIESVEEVRIEMVLRESQSSDVERAIRRVHPYEEPAIDMYRLTEAAEMPLGRVGYLAARVALKDLLTEVDTRLETRSMCWGDKSKPINRVAVAGGAAGSLWKDAAATGADVLITGEVKQDQAMEASDAGLAIIAAGHYATEQPGVRELAKRLSKAIPEVIWEIFDPQPGELGRPLIGT